jgi:integrase
MGRLRLRGSLGTRNQEFGRKLLHKIEQAILEGPDSCSWSELKSVLPLSTYSRLADLIGVMDKHERTWIELSELFTAHMCQRVQMGKLQHSTSHRYKATLAEFDTYLGEQGISLLRGITKGVVEEFKGWRIDRIKKKKHSRGGTGLVLDTAILHRVFAVALDHEWITKNPVRMEESPGENPTNGAEPFTAEQLFRLREHAADDLLASQLLRWTGLRGSDVVSLSWKEVYFDRKEIERVTQKRKKKVILPLHSELLFALEAEFERRKPEASDRVLLNPYTGKSLTRPRLYYRLVALGKRAGVANSHPHRFRDTLAVDMLLRGASPYDVAKMLGDTIETVEKHYAPFVKELRERVRGLLENDSGLECVTPPSQSLRRIQ